MATVSTTPAVALPNTEITVTFDLTGDAGNFVRVWCTNAPAGSELFTKLQQDASSRNRIEVFADDAAVDIDAVKRARWVHKFDKGGKYTLVVQRYTLASDWGGGYEGDTRAYPLNANGLPTKEKLEGGESALSLHIAQELTQPIGPPPDTATLLLYVRDGTIVETTHATHGVDSPAIIDPAPGRARAAAESTTVLTALENLIDEPVSTAFPDANTAWANIRAEFNDHIALGSSHFSADTDNSLKAEYASAQSPESLKDAVSLALSRFRRHMLNDNGGGTGTANYHQISSVNKADFANAPLFKGVGSPSETYGGIADLWRCHEGHRVNTAVHTAADNTNALTALALGLELHRQFLAIIATMSPTPPPGQSAGAMTLIARAGFKES